uniref:Uncharacterized protein n=1 Tax=Anguilla anguilla TaxID=7936 RepID=A0A0E9SLE5_ANGAN
MRDKQSMHEHFPDEILLAIKQCFCAWVSQLLFFLLSFFLPIT